MTEKKIKSFIDKLNKDRANGLFFLRPLSNKVEYAIVWSSKPKPTDECDTIDYYPEKFYFIKNDNGIYVGAILIMSEDLHWYILPQYRKLGHLTNAMKSTILFHLFQEKDEQKITIDKNSIGAKKYDASRNVALNLGFIENNKKDISEFVLKSDDYKSDDCFLGLNTELTEERFQELKKQLHYLSRSLLLIQNEIEIKTGYSDYSYELKDLVKEIRPTGQFESVYWKNKREINEKD